MRRVGLYLVVLAMVTVALPATPAAGVVGPSVYAVNSAVTVRATTSVAAADKLISADLIAARNEFESTQIVVEAGNSSLSNVTVAMANGAGLIGPDGASIPGGNITIYREHSYNVPVNKVSDGEGGVGPWPDPLIPTVDPYYGQSRNAFPVNVPAGERVVAWIDVLVPQGQPAGQYNGFIQVTSTGGVLETVPLRLNVLDFTIPSTSSIDSAFLTQDNRLICRAHTGTDNCGNEEKRWALHSLYARAALENRVTLSNIAPLGQNSAPPTGDRLAYFDKYIEPLINGRNPGSPPLSVASQPWSAVRLPGAKLTTQSIYGYAGHHCLAACVASWETFAQARTYKNRLWLYACDEPGRDAAKWDACEERGLTNAQTTLRKLVTAHPKDAMDNDNLSNVDIMVTNVRQMTGKPHCCGERFETYSGYASYFAEFMAEPTGPSNKLWLYTACDSMGCDDLNSGNPDWNHQLYDGWASYGIDQPSTQARMAGWLVYLYDASGELYYDMTAKLPTAWTDSFFFGAQGDGTFFYPGVAKAGSGEQAGTVTIGGTDDIPIESLRLKRVRDSREDYEYLRKLQTLYGTTEAMARTKDLFGEATDTLNASRNKAAWTTPTATELQRVRCDMASRITGTAACSFDDAGDPPPEGQADLAVTTTADRAPTGPNFTFKSAVTNNGPDPATDVRLYDHLPAGVEVISTAGAPCTDIGDGAWRCDVGDLAVGETSTIRFVVRPGHEGPLQNNVTVEGLGDPNPANSVATHRVGPAFICDIRGTAKADSLVGTDAPEVICGHGGDDVLLGGKGDDLLFGGPGSDSVRYTSSPHAMTVNLNFQRSDAEGAWPRYDGQAGHGLDHFHSIERAIGSRHDDHLLGRTAKTDHLWGGKGPDTIRGYGGDDVLYGGPGRDELYGGEGADTVKGGTGSDLCRDLDDTLIACER